MRPNRKKLPLGFQVVQDKSQLMRVDSSKQASEGELSQTNI